MLSSQAGTIILVVILCAVAVAGLVVGAVSTRVVGLPWSIRTGLADSVIAPATYVVAALVLKAVALEEGVTLISAAIMAVLSAVLRHIGRRMIRHTARPAAP